MANNIFKMSIKNILLPGGIGYIGSHVVVQLLVHTPHNLIIVDNYYNSNHNILSNIYQAVLIDADNMLDVEAYKNRVTFYEGNILDISVLEHVFRSQNQKNKPITSIIHFAAKKSAPESVQQPMDYYQNNVIGSINLIKLMTKYKQCKQFIFSSSAAVYGEQDDCTQQFACNPISPYGQTKLCVDWLLRSMANANPDWKVISLRYFNPAGNHHSGLIGDNPVDNVAGNLFAIIQQVIIKKRSSITVFGSDYKTFDGTGVRDFVHVDDLAKGHIKAFDYLSKMNKSNYQIFNLGSGHGFSVLQVLHTFQQILNQKLPYNIGGRREGDLERLVTASNKAESILGWKTKKTLRDMCESCIKFTTAIKLSAGKQLPQTDTQIPLN